MDLVSCFVWETGRIFCYDCAHHCQNVVFLLCLCLSAHHYTEPFPHPAYHFLPNIKTTEEPPPQPAALTHCYIHVFSLLTSDQVEYILNSYTTRRFFLMSAIWSDFLKIRTVFYGRMLRISWDVWQPEERSCSVFCWYGSGYISVARQQQNNWLILALLLSYVLLLAYYYGHITLLENIDNFNFSVTKLLLPSIQIC